jgi:hypothetical protein
VYIFVTLWTHNAHRYAILIIGEDVSFTVFIILIVGLLGLGLYKNPTRDNHYTRITIMRIKLMQEDLKHGRKIKNYNNLV